MGVKKQKKETLPLERWLWISTQLKLKGLSFAQISLSHGYHKSAAGLVRYHRYPVFEKIIADIIGVSPSVLFPERYTPDGRPIGRAYSSPGRAYLSPFMDENTLRERLRRIRGFLGLSQKEMAKKISISTNAWQGYELGRNEPGSGVIKELVNLGFNANWILTGEGEMRLPE